MNAARFQGAKPEKRSVFWSVPVSHRALRLGDLATANQPFGTDIPFFP